ncbi:MAG: glycosyltransferase family 4 protein, partial [Thermodesulfobacteriota bacterium]
FIFAAAFIVTLAATPVARKAAMVFGVYDRPENELKVHKKPIPYLGGLAILAGLAAAVFVASRFFSFNPLLMTGLYIAAALIALTGALDDILDIKQRYKFFIQIALALGLVAAGFRVELLPFWPVVVIISVFFIVGASNALNLLDGLDGLAAGVTSIAAIFFFIIFTKKGDVTGMTLSASLAGATMAFLVFNFNPASIFMGDAGSMLLGLMLAVLMIWNSRGAYDFTSLFVSILICGVPIFDTALAFTRRYLNNRPIFPGDRSHFYDQLRDRGFSVKKTALTSYALGGFFGVTALFVSVLPVLWGLVFFALVVAGLAAAVKTLRMLTIEV